MPKNFHQVTLSLRSDSWRTSSLALMAGAVLLVAWSAWAWFARISQYEVSDTARLEVRSNPTTVQANFEGRIAAVQMRLGEMVQQGDVLLVVDSRPEQLALAEELTKEAALGPRITALKSEIAAEQAGSGDDASVLTLSSRNAADQVRQAEAESELADKDNARAKQLKAEGIISEAEAQRAAASAESKHAALEALRHTLSRLNPEYKLRQRTRQAHVDDLIGQQANLEGELASARAERQRLQYEIERKTLRAPISGRLAECLPLAPGGHVAEGDKLGVILPSDQLQIVAEFAPAAAFGKLHPGQYAALRLDGFPWAQYGVVHAQVSNVASEIRNGKVRVELAVTGGLKSGVPLQHGLPGTVEVETEQVSPLALLLRTAGDLAGKH